MIPKGKLMSNQEHELKAGWQRRFFTVWTGQAFSMLGTMVVQFALIWWLTVESGGSATVLAFASLMGMLPQILLGPVVGTLVDRWNRRVVMMVADSCAALVTLALALLFFTGQVAPVHVFVALFLRSLAEAFQQPAMNASTSLMVPHKHLSRVAGLNSLLGGLSNIITPPIGALLIVAKVPIQYIVLLDVISAIPAVTPLFFVSVPQPPRTAKSAKTGSSVWHEFLEGLRYVRGWPGLMLLMVLAMLINFLLTPAFSLLPLLIKNHFQGGAEQLALVNSVFGIGVIVGSVLLGVWGGFKRRIVTSLMGIALIAAGVLCIAFAPASAFSMAIIGMVIVGISMPIANGPLQAIMQSTVEPGMQGRVDMLTGSLATAMTPLSLLVAGPVADAISIQGWFIAAGLICAFFGVSGFFIPALMHMEDKKNETAPAENTVREEPLGTVPAELA